MAGAAGVCEAVQHAASLPKQVSAAELRACLHVSASRAHARAALARGPSSVCAPRLPRPCRALPAFALCIALGIAMWMQRRLT